MDQVACVYGWSEDKSEMMNESFCEVCDEWGCDGRRTMRMRENELIEKEG